MDRPVAGTAAAGSDGDKTIIAGSRPRATMGCGNAYGTGTARRRGRRLGRTQHKRACARPSLRDRECIPGNRQRTGDRIRAAIGRHRVMDRAIAGTAFAGSDRDKAVVVRSRPRAAIGRLVGRTKCKRATATAANATHRNELIDRAGTVFSPVFRRAVQSPAARYKTVRCSAIRAVRQAAKFIHTRQRS